MLAAGSNGGTQATVVGQVVMTDGTIQPVLAATAPSASCGSSSQAEQHQAVSIMTTTTASIMMPGRECRRQSEPLRAQHLWDAIRAVKQQKQIPAIQVFYFFF